MPHKWEQVAEHIRADLGEPGSLLPSEADLIVRYGVSKNTVRRALDHLARLGLVDGNPRTRRKVRDTSRYIYNLNRLGKAHRPGVDAWAATVLDQGATNPETFVRSEMVSAAEMVARQLQINVGDFIVSRPRVHSIAGAPHQLSRSYYPRFVTDGHDHLFLVQEDVTVPGGLMAASGHRQVRFSDYIATRLPEGDEADLLLIPPTMYLLALLRTGYEVGGRPVRVEEDLWPADQAGLTVDVPNA